MSKQVRAVVSNLPIETLEDVRSKHKFIASLLGKTVRIRFRGPRHDWQKKHTRKCDAVGFSVYYV